MAESETAMLWVLLLQVSQFTLYAMAKGNKPDYHLAMPPDQVLHCCHTVLSNHTETHNDSICTICCKIGDSFRHFSLLPAKSALIQRLVGRTFDMRHGQHEKYMR